MKKRRILALIAALLCLSMCFVACRKNDEDITDETSDVTPPAPEPAPIMEQIFNPAWKPVPDLTPTAATKIELTGDYEDCTNNLVLTSTINSDGNKVQSVFSLVTGKVLNTFTDTETQYTDPDNNNVYNRQLKHYVYLPENVPFYVVLTAFDKDIDTYKNSVHSYLFDAYVPFDNYDTYDIELSMKLYNITAPEAIATIEDGYTIENVAEEAYHSYDFDYCLREYQVFSESDEYDNVTFDNKTYDIDLEENTITAPAEGLNVLSKKEYTHETKDNYIYYYDGNVTIMDKSFKTLFAYSAPYESELMSVNVLNNGSVLVQYATKLPAAATSYDFIETGIVDVDKYDLTSVILKADKTETKVELDYIVSTTWTAYELSEMYEGDYLAEGVENLATIQRKNESGYINYNTVDEDIVILDNDAAVVKSVKVLHNQIGIPQNLGNGIYEITVDTNLHTYYYGDYTNVYEYVLTNAKGEEIYTSATSYADNFGINTRYVQIGEAIYDKNTSKVVYDLKANKASVEAIFSNSFIVSIYNENDGVTSYYKVNADETKLLGVVGGSNPTISSFEAYSNFYAIKQLDTGFFTYYNENDTVITGTPELTRYIHGIVYGEDCALLQDADWNEDKGEFIYTYYIIK